MVTGIAGLESGAVTSKERIRDTGVYKKYNDERFWYESYYTFDKLNKDDEMCKYKFVVTSPYLD